MKNLTSLNKLPNTRVFVAAENGSVEVLELVALFLLETGTFGAENLQAISVDTMFCFVEILFLKREGQKNSTFDKQKFFNLTRIQHKVLLLVLRTVFAVGFSLNFIRLLRVVITPLLLLKTTRSNRMSFRLRRFLITQFLPIKLWARIYLCRQEKVRQHSSPICASTFTNVLALHFKVKFDQHFVQRVLRSRLTSNL